MYQIRRKMIVYISRLLFPAPDGNMSTTKGQTPGKKETNMTRKAQTYLTRIKAAGSIYDLQGVEIAFKQDSTLGWDDISRLCKAADEKRYTLTNSEDTIRLKNLLFFRVKAEMDAYHDMSRAPESNKAEEIERQRARFCSVWQVLEEAELVDEYDAWKNAGGGAK